MREWVKVDNFFKFMFLDSCFFRVIISFIYVERTDIHPPSHSKIYCPYIN